jgi:cold shock CspA family protein
LSTRGIVAEWDEHAGIGTITVDGGASYFFHCTQIADGTRTIDAGTEVSFEVVAGHLGRWEAARVEKL